ncbi:MAG: isocitrate lyase [Coxiella sp. RIFCSPHIGHO2_12_FULL_44_14]|nr:MAG: isocitrate lyase [Coxiella sp. RIFCSPHIGHO2_12_FULL_44_14]
MDARQQLRHSLETKQTIVAPGVFDGLSARLVEQANFKAIYASGGAIARSSGFPDLGILSFDEVVIRLNQIVEVTSIPVIADADTGFGNALNVRRTFRVFERMGIAAAHIEDQNFPKRCGHLDDKSLISQAEMVYKIKAARDELTDDRFVLIARTDAIAVEGFDRAIERANAYAEAGADVIFVEAPETLEQIQKISQQVTAPKLINMFYGGKTPLVPLDQLQQMGYLFVIIPSDLQRAAIYAMQKTLAAIKKDGDSKRLAPELTSFKEREKIIDTDGYLAKS